MEPDPDELAGVADLFGGLSRAELSTAFEHLAARAGTSFDEDSLLALIDEAVTDYFLVALEHDGATVLAPGPRALPSLPERGEDLPHMMEIEQRQIDSLTVAKATEQRIRTDAAQAIAADDAERAELLIDACYEVEAWGAVDTSDIRSELDALL